MNKIQLIIESRKYQECVCEILYYIGKFSLYNINILKKALRAKIALQSGLQIEKYVIK